MDIGLGTIELLLFVAAIVAMGTRRFPEARWIADRDQNGIVIGIIPER